MKGEARCYAIAFMTSVLFSGCFAPSPYQLQKKFAESLRPKPLDDGPDWPSEARKLRVRAYADAGHREAVLGWQVRFYRLVERVNPVLRKTLGVELDVVSAEAWDRATPAGGLAGALFELQGHDAGEDIDFVVGLVTPLPMVSHSQIDLGRAHLFGHHLVMRPGDDLQWFDGLNKGLDLLDEDEREELYYQIRRRRAELILLHEIGHVLGALHVTNPDRIMAPRLASKISGFTDHNLRLMRIVVESRGDGRRRSREAASDAIAAYRRELEAIDDAILEPEARARMLAFFAEPRRRLATQADLHPVDPTNSTPPSGLRPGSDDREIAAAASKMAEDAPEAAWLMLAPVLTRHPKQSEFQDLGCQLGLRRNAAAEETAEVCDRAVRLRPWAIQPRLWRAFGRQQRKALAGAVADARAAELKLVATATAPPELWNDLARVYRGLSAVSWAENAADRMTDPEQQSDVRAWAKKVRAAYLLPKDAANKGVPPEREPAYIALRARLSAAVGARDAEQTRRLQRELRRAFPKLSQTSGQCRILVDKRQWAAAWRACRAAARSAPQSADAQTLAAVAAFGVGQPDRAVRPLERALRLAPERADVWKLLGTAYRFTGNTSELQRLRTRYKARFGRALPR